MSRDETLDIVIEPVKELPVSGKAYLVVVGGREYRLPQSRTDVAFDGGVITGVRIPRWLAENEGLVELETPLRQTQDGMSREDWFLLVTTAALLTRNLEPRKAYYEARIVTRLLLGEEE